MNNNLYDDSSQTTCSTQVSSENSYITNTMEVEIPFNLILNDQSNLSCPKTFEMIKNINLNDQSQIHYKNLIENSGNLIDQHLNENNKHYLSNSNNNFSISHSHLKQMICPNSTHFRTDLPELRQNVKNLQSTEDVNEEFTISPQKLYALSVKSEIKNKFFKKDYTGVNDLFLNSIFNSSQFKFIITYGVENYAASNQIGLCLTIFAKTYIYTSLERLSHCLSSKNITLKCYSKSLDFINNHLCNIGLGEENVEVMYFVNSRSSTYMQSFVKFYSQKASLFKSINVPVVETLTYDVFQRQML
uniref:Uncharacterized protein n=1 Tax=Strongyloides stercoralis TaxID=6248 RepID=A0AAF5I2S4_STRER